MITGLYCVLVEQVDADHVDADDRFVLCSGRTGGC